jgi:hypothetical protein
LDLGPASGFNPTNSLPKQQQPTYYNMAEDFDIDDLMAEMDLEDELSAQLRLEEEAMLAAELAQLESDPSLAQEVAERRAAESLKAKIEENKRRAAEKRAA